MAIYRSSDTGLSWDSITQLYGNPELRWVFIDQDTIYAHFYNNEFKSTDLGLSWQSCTIPEYITPVSVSLSNGDIIYGNNLGVNKKILSQNQNIPTNTGFYGQNIQAFHIVNQKLFCSTDYEVFRSLDGGLSWSKVLSYAPYVCKILSFSSSGDTIIFTENMTATIGYSFDGGATWDSISFPSISYYNMYFLPMPVKMTGSRIYFSSMTETAYTDNWGGNWVTMPQLPVMTTPGPGNSETGGFLDIINNTLYSVTLDGYLFRYDEISGSWVYLTYIQSSDIYSSNIVYSIDNLLVVNGDRDFKYSADGGNTWITPANNGLPQGWQGTVYPRDVHSIQGAWIGGNFLSGFYVSSDMGNNWTFQANNSSDFTPLSFTKLNGALYAASLCASVWRQNNNNYFTSSGKVYLDSNNNGQADPGEANLPYIGIISSPSNYLASTDSTGVFNFTTDVVGEKIAPILPLPFVTVNPPWRIITGPLQNQDFGIYMPPNIADLSIDMTNINIFRPGFDTKIVFTVLNKGSVTQSPQVIFIKPAEVTFVSANPAPLTINGDTITWQFGSLGFLNSLTFELIVKTNVGVPNGDSVICSAIVYPVIGDSYRNDNYCTIKDIVMGSYDPNDKTCVQGEYFTPLNVIEGKELEYVIRFQNLGNLATSFIKITDTLSPNLDWSSFRFVSSSHPVKWSLHGQGIIEFEFDPLALPPASIDELGSMGFVKYSIKCKPGCQVGTAITNEAYIYFDYNLPVITNTTTTLIADIVAHIEYPANPKQGNKIFVYPNPATTSLFVDVTGEITDRYQAIIFDYTGRQVMDVLISENRTCLNTSDLPSGLYMGSIFTSKGNKIGTFKFVVSRR